MLNTKFVKYVGIFCFATKYNWNNNICLHNFFLSLLLLIRCILSLSQAFFFKQYRIKNIWSPNRTQWQSACAVIQAVLGSIPGGDQSSLVMTVP